MKQSKAFTLIELLVVIAIIGFIASIVLVNLQGVRGRGRIAAGKQFSSSLQHTLGAYAVGIWRFEDGSGTTALDSSGYINNGTLNGGATWRTETECGLELGGCLEFDGVGDYVDMGGGSSLLPDTWTISAWVKPDDVTQQHLATFHATGNYPTISLEWGATGRPIIIMDANNYQYFVASAWTTLKDGNWHHVAFIMPGSAQADINNVEMYLDGISVAKHSAAQATAGQIAKNRFKVGTIGTELSFYSGKIDDVHIFSTSLTTAQVQKLYAEGLPNHQLAQQ